MLKTREKMHNFLNSMDTTTNKDEENNPDTRNVIFSYATNLEFLKNSAEDIFLDKIYKCCPEFFFINHTFHDLCC